MQLGKLCPSNSWKEAARLTYAAAVEKLGADLLLLGTFKHRILEDLRQPAFRIRMRLPEEGFVCCRT
jgi:hypothetical protein